MLDLTGKVGFISEIKELIFSIIDKRDKTQKNKKTEFIVFFKSMLEAVNCTKKHIAQQGYVSNDEIKNLWFIALENTIQYVDNKRIEEYMFEKVKFWGNPEEWINKNETKEIVPTLDEIIIVLREELKKF